MDFSVIIVAYAEDAALSAAVESLLSQDLPRNDFEICVVENRPHPQTKSRYGDRIEHWVTPGKNVGASAGRNLGAKHTSAPTLCFIDDDGVVDESFLASMKQVLKERPEAAAVRGRLLPLKQPGISALNYAYDLGDSVRDCLLDIEGATCIRREAYDRAGGFRSGLFDGEGLDLMVRMLEADPRQAVLYNPGAILYHDFAESYFMLWKKGKRVVERGELDIDSNPLLVERRAQLRQRYPRLRPSLATRIRKAPAEIVFRVSKRVHRLLHHTQCSPDTFDSDAK